MSPLMVKPDVLPQKNDKMKWIKLIYTVYTYRWNSTLCNHKTFLNEYKNHRIQIGGIVKGCYELFVV